jgi:hypothetical protein
MQKGRFDPVTKKKKQEYEPFINAAPLIMICLKSGTMLLIIKYEAYFFLC